MAEPLVQRGLDWISDFGDFISDAGAALPFDLDVEARTEPTPPGLYDVGTIVRAYQLQWLGEAPNHATPLELHELLLTLDTLTQQLEEEISNHEESSLARTVKLGIMGLPLWIVADKARRGEQRSLQQVTRDLRRWRERLDDYLSSVEAVLPQQEQDRRAVLWEVTAPLLLGFYGGPTGAETPVVGQPDGFDPTIQQLADIGTPYRIANELGVWLDWGRRRKELFKEDIKEGATRAGKGLGLAVLTGIAGVGVGVAGAQLVKGKRS